MTWICNATEIDTTEAMDIVLWMWQEASYHAAGDLLTFMADKDDEILAVISKKVLHRPQDCLSLLKKDLMTNMIKIENDQRPRRWLDGAGHCLYYQALRGICQLELTSSCPQSKLVLPHLSRSLHNLLYFSLSDAQENCCSAWIRSMPGFHLG